MPNFETGVSGYIHGTTTIRVGFPVDWNGHQDVCCDQCRYLRRQSRTCGLTGDLVPYPARYIAPTCPLEFEEEDDGNL